MRLGQRSLIVPVQEGVQMMFHAMLVSYSWFLHKVQQNLFLKCRSARGRMVPLV